MAWTWSWKLNNKNFDDGVYTRPQSGGSNGQGGQGMSFNPQDLDIISKGFSEMGTTISNFGSTERDPSLGTNVSMSSPWAAIAGTAGKTTVGLLDAIDKVTDTKKYQYDPFRRTGLAYGGHKFDAGGWASAMDIGNSALKIASNAVGKSKLTTSYEDFKDRLDQYARGVQDSYSGVDDNEELLNAWGNTTYVTDGLKARDFRNKSVLSDVSGNLASSFEGFSAGSTFGPWGAAIGAVVGGVADLVGTVIGRNKASNAAKAGNKAIHETNHGFDRRLQGLAGTVDEANDRRRMEAYMDDVYSAALGGQLSTHGSDFTDGINIITAGGTHEQNPLGGVPQGIAEDGAPNLVEEGEVIWNDYVFSNRLKPKKSLLKKYGMGGNLSYADFAKKILEDTNSKERPNDPITQRTNNAILEELRDLQEEHRARNAEKEMLKALEQMSPEELNALLSGDSYAYGGHMFVDGGDETPKINIPLHQVGEANKSEAEMWATYSAPTVKKFFEEAKKRYDEAKTPEEKEAIRKEVKEKVYALQKGHAISSSHKGGKTAKFSNDVANHQDAWNEAGLNAGFTDIDSDITTGYKGRTGDNNAMGFKTDGLYGPRTAIRHLGKKGENDAVHNEIAEIASSMDLDWSPTEESNGYYLLSDKKKKATDTENQPKTKSGDTESSSSSAGGNTDSQRGPQTKGGETEGTTGGNTDGNTGGNTGGNGTGSGTKFKYEPTWMRYAPIWGNGALALNSILTPPDFTEANTLAGAANRLGVPVHIPVERIGDFRKRKPFDERYLTNLANADFLAALHAAESTSGGNRAMQLAAGNILAYNNARTLGEIGRQAYIANRQDDADVAAFNRGTHQFNAQSGNQRNIAQAQLNSERQAASTNALAKAMEMKVSAKDKRDKAISQNLSAFLQGLGDMGNENMQQNWMTSLAENGALSSVMGQNGQIYHVPQSVLQYFGTRGGGTDSTGTKPVSGKCGGKLKKKRRF